jgi:hypothetical protein
VQAKVDGQVLALQIDGLPADLRGKALDYFAADAVRDRSRPAASSSAGDGERLALPRAAVGARSEVRRG